MVKMDNYYAQDHQLQEVWKKIDQLHLSYLEMEESPEKLEQRNKLEDCIAKYLCLPSPQKFYFAETEEVLHRSASSKKDFSGYKAATGWNAIQLYAGNLLSQPWRKEYRTIKKYSGFYKHQIEANLVGAELMFEAMGYKHVGNGILVLDGPICPDRVENVSKDSLMAYVECQILKAIWEEVSTPLNISWLEVLEFHRVHRGTPEQAVKALQHQHQLKHLDHLRAYSVGSAPYAKYPAAGPAAQSFPPLGAHHAAPLVYANGCGCAQHGFAPYMPYVPCGNGYCFGNGYAVPTVVPQAYGFPVPTGQLLELDSHNGYDAVDAGVAGHSRQRKVSRESVVMNDLYRSKNNNEFDQNGTASTIPDKEEPQYEEDWDYVYRDLESKGYNKDLGGRGDILNPTSIDRRRHTKEPKKVKSTNLEEAMNSLTVSDRPLKVTESEIKKNDTAERRNSQGSLYDNVMSNDVVKTTKAPTKVVNTSSFARTKTLQRDVKEVKEVPKVSHSKTLDLRKMREEKATKKEENSTKWQCIVCTFLNDGTKDICDMCSKSKSPKQEQPMEVGGSECLKCTLVNPKSSKVCEACGASLKHSPTYI